MKETNKEYFKRTGNCTLCKKAHLDSNGYCWRCNQNLDKSDYKMRNCFEFTQ